MRTRPSTSRRTFLKSGAGLAAGAATLPWLTAAAVQQNQTDETLDFVKRANGDRNHRFLLQGGTIISMDPQVGNFVKGDVLIEGKKILSVGANIRAAGQRIDASGMVVIPGFADAHRHAWEGQLRGINPNAVTLADYNAYTHQGFGPFYRPHDVYVGKAIQSAPWTQLALGDNQTAMAKPAEGKLVLAGMKKGEFTTPYSRGHIAVVHGHEVAGHLGCRHASWGSLDGTGAQAGTFDGSIHNTFPISDVSKIHYAFQDISWVPCWRRRDARSRNLLRIGDGLRATGECRR